VPTKRDIWVVIEELGRGGFGAVYKVHNKSDPGKVYAMKTEVCTVDESIQ